jgi:hypothetical protein
MAWAAAMASALGVCMIGADTGAAILCLATAGAGAGAAGAAGLSVATRLSSGVVVAASPGWMSAAAGAVFFLAGPRRAVVFFTGMKSREWFFG